MTDFQALAGLAVIIVFALLAWLLSLRRNDVSIVDSFWSLFIAGAGITYVVVGHADSAPPGARASLALALTLFWAVRLSVFLTWRAHGQPEDRRYREIRARNQPNFAIKSLYLVFGLQAFLAWIVSLPLLATAQSQAPLNALDAVGVALYAFGIVFEAIADQQMTRFRSQPGSAGRVLDEGLWRYSRHPNYFGECCVWWGLFAIALADGGAWTIVSPLLMTVLLLKVSGVTLLEAGIDERRPAYRDYVLRTNAFLPGPPRKGLLP